MTINLALEYIPKRMEELGFKNNYSLRFRHLVLQPNENQLIQAFNQLFYLVEEAENVRVESENGVFDLSEGATNEMQYEHQNHIQLINYSSDLRHVRFIQVIPNHISTK